MKHFSRLSISCLLVVWIAACDNEDRPFDEGDVEWAMVYRDLWVELRKPFGSEFTDEELATVTHLRLATGGPVWLGDEHMLLLARCINLKELFMDDAGPEDEQLRALAGLTALEVLGLSGNTLRDLTPLAGFTNLRELYLSRNAIRDLSPLAGLINLQTLDLVYNDIADITPLKGLIQLEKVYLDHNQIVDLKPLVDNPGLGFFDPRVSVGGNPLSEVSRTEHIPALQARGVIVCQ